MSVLRGGSARGPSEARTRVRRRALSNAALIAAVALGTTVYSQRVFRSGVDLVHFSISVTDKRGNPVTELAREDFEVSENGVLQTITHFVAGASLDAKEADGTPQLPLHIGLVFDTSGSMSDDLKFAQMAAIKFLNALPQAQDITIVDFDTEVRVARFSQTDFPRLVERLRGRKADGWTALYDAVGVYLDGATDQDGEKILVLYTDGGDTRSQTDFGAVIDMLKMTDVTAYAVGLLEHQSSSVKTDQRMRLQQMSNVAGGLAFFPTSKEQLDEIYDRILREVTSRYRLGYVSSDPRANGAWRPVKVRLKRPDLKDARIRTRAGYFAPLREPAR